MKFHFVKAQIANGAPKKYLYRNFYLERFLTEAGELLQTKRFSLSRTSASAKTARNQQHWSGAPNEDIVQNHLNIVLLNVF